MNNYNLMNNTIELDFDEFDNEFDDNEINLEDIENEIKEPIIINLNDIEENISVKSNKYKINIDNIKEDINLEDKNNIKNITKDEIIDYDNYEVNIGDNKKHNEIVNNFKKNNNKTNDIANIDLETMVNNKTNDIANIDLETMVNVVNENKREFEDLKSAQIFKMDILFAKLMANGGYVKEPKNKENFDNLVNEMDDFVDNCIMRATDKYSIKNKLHIININNLIQRIKTYKEENKLKNNKNVKLNNSSNKILNIHNHIIYYKVENKWFEISYRGLNIVKEDYNKDLNFCIDNLNKKDKYRKKNLSFNIRAIKLRYLLNNIKTEFFYLYKEKN
jgi:hypothetical protein